MLFGLSFGARVSPKVEEKKVEPVAEETPAKPEEAVWVEGLKNLFQKPV